MSWKESKVRNVLTNTCPKCREGKVFKHKTTLHPRRFDKMHERCLKCNHRFEMETGFFYGAMYASYATTVAMSVAMFVLTYLIFPSAPYWVYIINILTILIVLSPVNFRLGRLIWINMFTGYDPNAIKEFEESKKKNE